MALANDGQFAWRGCMHFTDDGEILADGYVVIKLTGTDTDAVSYSDQDRTVENTNPVALDASGRQPAIFFDAGGYDLFFYDADDVATGEEVIAFIVTDVVDA